ncbi:MAG: carotenoid biosynthesis protein [Candidatus Heimdallarchaeota archaeon]|nr:carotenoid biosynthesis protein [Candidatus Heimdallarchaeota archaeon]
MVFSIFAWIFSIGGLLAYFTMSLHSLLFMERKKTMFIFGGGTTIAYFLEFTLSNILELYSYQNLPITLYSIPIVIPCGWIVSFYGLYHISLDITDSNSTAIATTGFIGMLFGLGIESLAKNTDFWVFHFEFTEFLNTPLNVILAWGFSTANFAWGIQLFEKYNKQYSLIWIPILIIIHSINIVIAILLS